MASAVADYQPTDPQIAWHLAHFITEVRSIPADPVVLRQNWLEAYNYVTDKGALALNDYARTNDPFSKIGKAQVSVDVASVIRASDSSFRVEWIERRYVDNALASTERWSAILTIVVQPPTDADRLKKIRSASTSTPSTGQRSSADAHRLACNPVAYLCFARRLRDGVETAGDQLRQHAEAGSASARPAEARSDR